MTFDQLARKVYIGLRDGGLEPEATFDLACILMDWGPASPAVRQLAEQSVAGTDPVLLADLAGQVLEERPRPWRWCMKWPPRDLFRFKQELPLLSIQPH